MRRSTKGGGDTKGHEEKKLDGEDPRGKLEMTIRYCRPRRNYNQASSRGEDVTGGGRRGGPAELRGG